MVVACNIVVDSITVVGVLVPITVVLKSIVSITVVRDSFVVSVALVDKSVVAPITVVGNSVVISIKVLWNSAFFTSVDNPVVTIVVYGSSVVVSTVAELLFVSNKIADVLFSVNKLNVESTVGKDVCVGDEVSDDEDIKKSVVSVTVGDVVKLRRNDVVSMFICVAFKLLDDVVFSMEMSDEDATEDVDDEDDKEDVDERVEWVEESAKKHK